MSHWYCFNCILVVLNIFWKACTHLIITLREASSWLIKPFYNVFKTFQENVFHESATDLYATSYKRFFWSFFRRLDLTEKRRFLWTLFAKSCKTRCLVHKKTFSWCQYVDQLKTLVLNLNDMSYKRFLWPFFRLGVAVDDQIGSKFQKSKTHPLLVVI